MARQFIHGVHWRCAEPERGLWRSDLVFDIDHILEWVPSGDRCVRFLMAPAILVFHDAADLDISFRFEALAGHRRMLGELSIDTVARERAEPVRLGRDGPSW